MVSEFDLIARYFTRPAKKPSIPLGVGDDCALLHLDHGMELAISSDMLVAGQHFFVDTDPRMLGHRCLAVNLSDLAAMGAEPWAFTLALALPEVRDDWLLAFSEGLWACAEAYDCPLIGGDTTRGPLTMSITILGKVPKGTALCRHAAQVGDDIWVSGALGEARLALAEGRLHEPTPRVALGIALRGLAHAAVDISDGLVGDLGQVLTRSGLGATINVDALPFGPVLATQATSLQRQYALSGGDDYELCFTAPRANVEAIVGAAQRAQTPVTRVGVIESMPGLRFSDAAGKPLALSLQAFDHFLSPSSDA